MFFRHQFFTLVVILHFIQIQEPRHVGLTLLHLLHSGIMPGGVSTFVPHRILLGNLPSNNLGLNLCFYQSIDLVAVAPDINDSLLIISVPHTYYTIFIDSVTTVAFIGETGGSTWVIIINADIVIRRRDSVQYSSKILVVWSLSSVHW